MNIQQLEYIIAVDKHRHFLKASESCFVTQATLSAMIKKLEDELKVILFDRSKQPVVPTDIGQKIIAQAKISLREIYLIQDIIKEDADEIRGELRIGIIPTLAPYLLPLFLKDFLINYPNISLTINEYNTHKIQDKLKDGLIDVAILAIPLTNKTLIEEHLFYEEFFYYSENESLADSKSYIIPKDINLTTLLLLEEGHCFRNQMINLCELRTKDLNNLKIDYQSGSIETLKRMVDIQMGSTILPELALATLTKEQKMRVNKFEQPSPARQIGLVMHHHFIKKKLIEALKKTILNSIPKEMTSRNNIAIIPIK